MRILVVDDEPRHVAGMLRLLSRMRPNAEVKGAFSGEEALKTMPGGRPIHTSWLSGMRWIAACVE